MCQGLTNTATPLKTGKQHWFGSSSSQETLPPTVIHTTHQTPEFAPPAPLILTMDMEPPTSRPKTLEDMEHLDVFYLFFGLLRQSIWKVDPKMKDILLAKQFTSRRDYW
jgi:hypothetical protein